MKATKTWVLIADGKRACVFENSGPNSGLTAVPGLSFEVEPVRPQDDLAGSLTSGKSTQSTAGGRDTGIDPAALRESNFLKLVVETLDRRHSNGAFERLVIAAAPSALGEIRRHLSPQLSKCIMAELPKDLMNIPKADLEKHFEDVFAV